MIADWSRFRGASSGHHFDPLDQLYSLDALIASRPPEVMVCRCIRQREIQSPLTSHTVKILSDGCYESLADPPTHHCPHVVSKRGRLASKRFNTIRTLRSLQNRNFAKIFVAIGLR